MQSHSALEIVRGHQIIRLPEGTVVLDTGSPFDIGRGGSFEVLGRHWRPPIRQVDILGTVSARLGTNVDWLLGTAFLMSYRVTLDPRRGRVTFSDDVMDAQNSQVLPTWLESGVPHIEISVSRAGPARCAILDSGAPVSYVPGIEVETLTPVRETSDFHPTVGEYRTPIFEVSITVGRRDVKVDAGILPPSLKARFGDVWIVGGDFFRDRVISLDYPAGRILDAPAR